MEDPDFTPGAIRAVLEDLDNAIAQVRQNIAMQAKSWDDVLLLRGRLIGLEYAKGLHLQRMDDEIKKRLGIKP